MRHCFSSFVFDWYLRNNKSWNSTSLILKEKNDKKEVDLIDFSKPLKQ